jgi:hypothetical protein
LIWWAAPRACSRRLTPTPQSSDYARRCRPIEVGRDLMKKAYWIDGRLLTERDLQDIRAQIQGFKAVTAISDEMRDVIETEWPDLAAKLLPPKTAP